MHAARVDSKICVYLGIFCMCLRLISFIYVQYVFTCIPFFLTEVALQHVLLTCLLARMWFLSGISEYTQLQANLLHAFPTFPRPLTPLLLSPFIFTIVVVVVSIVVIVIFISLVIFSLTLLLVSLFRFLFFLRFVFFSGKEATESDCRKR
jgi:hypothetical protein